MKPQTLTPHKQEKGQIIVIMALVFIGLVAIVGLAIDSGYMYVSYSRLRRAVDAAALSASGQFKKGVENGTSNVLDKTAREFLVLNGVPDSVDTIVDTCKTTKLDLVRYPGGAGDPALCTAPPRKLVRVTASQDVPLFFLSVVGIRSVPITITSISEAAALDVILVIDRSESMNNAPLNASGNPASNRDPGDCNAMNPTTTLPAGGGAANTWTGNCHPFQEVKAAAFSFVTTFLDPEYDRVAIVVFDHVAKPVNFGTTALPIYWQSDLGKLQTAIKGLWMYDGFLNTGGYDVREPDKYYGSYYGTGAPVDSTILQAPVCAHLAGGALPTSDFSPCRLHDASDHYFKIDCGGFYYPDFVPPLDTNIDGSTCGSTNIGHGINWASSIFMNHHARQEALWVTILLTDGSPNAAFLTQGEDSFPICPGITKTRELFCNDMDPVTRHNSDSADYDAEDYTKDQADALAGSSVIFSIGLGSTVADFGAPLLNYIAAQGDTTSYYQADANELQKVFLAIANKIATRLTK